MVSLTMHLHRFVRKVELTEAEWLEGIERLIETGHMCDDKCREFMLLSDMLCVSMLTGALNNRKPFGATEVIVFGPFHVSDSNRWAGRKNTASGWPSCLVSGACPFHATGGRI